jgi:hypothetical protein
LIGLARISFYTDLLVVERIKLTPAPASNGRFQPEVAVGNRGPERKRQRYRFRSALLHLLTVADPNSGEPNWITGCKKVIRAMNDGDIRAAKLVFDHAIGAPHGTVDITNRVE